MDRNPGSSHFTLAGNRRNLRHKRQIVSVLSDQKRTVLTSSNVGRGHSTHTGTTLYVPRNPRNWLIQCTISDTLRTQREGDSQLDFRTTARDFAEHVNFNTRSEKKLFPESVQIEEDWILVPEISRNHDDAAKV